MVESICCIIAGLIPTTVNPLLALCPVFVLSTFQWQIFTEAKHYNSSTLLSFHTDIFAGYFIVSYFDSKGVLFSLFPMSLAALCAFSVEKADSNICPLYDNTIKMPQINVLDREI